MTTFITSWLEARDLYETTRKRRLANNTYLMRLPPVRGSHAPCYGVRLHDTDVVIYRPDGSIMLDSDGFRTATTKRRINDYTPKDVQLWQQDFEWFVAADKSDTVPFHDGMVIEP